MSIFAIFTQEKDGRWSVSIPSLPGCFSEGETLEEAKKNIQEAMELYVEGEELENMDVQMVMSVELPQKKYA